MSNQVTLTIAGDSSSATRAMEQTEQAAEQLERQLDNVGSSAREMASQVGSSEDAFAGMGRQSGALGENLDRASGASSMLAGGLGDVGGALTEAFGEDHPIGQLGADLEKYGTIITGVTGLTDLLILANTALQATWVKNAAAQVGAKIATMATSVATGIATAAQWLWNVAMMANPLGLIILAIVALVAIIVLIATKTTWFQTIWETVWGAIKAYFEFVVNAWKTVFTAVWDAILAYFNFVIGAWKKAFQLVGDAVGWLMDLFRSIPGKIGDAFSRVKDLITAPFRAAFNFISDAWNNTIGRLSWTIPSWVPGVGGNSISAPRLPKFHDGGVVPGPRGSEMLALLEGGERVIPANQASSSTAAPSWVPTGDVLLDLLLEGIASRMRRRGGNPADLGLAGG
jgi:hypothetical protein